MFSSSLYTIKAKYFNEAFAPSRYSKAAKRIIFQSIESGSTLIKKACFIETKANRIYKGPLRRLLGNLKSLLIL